MGEARKEGGEAGGVHQEEREEKVRTTCWIIADTKTRSTERRGN